MKQICLLMMVCLFGACTQSAYRLPYPDGTSVQVITDDTTHSTPVARMYDFRAPQPGTALVAAKAGWVRFIKESGTSGSATNNYLWIEHPLDYCQPAGSTPPGNGGLASTCRECARGLGRCNEWSAYVHMVQNSVSAAGIEVGQWVTAGQALGTEGDVGFADCGGSTDPDCARHGHFHIWTMTEATLQGSKTPNDNGDYEIYWENFGREGKIPAFCTPNGLRRAKAGQTLVAAPCS